MPKLMLVLLLTCSVLCGCASQDTRLEADFFPAVNPETILTNPYEFYQPSDLETQTGGAVRSYPLDIPEVMGFLPMGEDILLFSGSDTTTLWKLTGQTLQVSASLPLSVHLTQDDPSLQITPQGISYYDGNAREVVILDSNLEERKRINVPADLKSTPVLSADQSTLYYCTDSTIRALDIAGGISRLLRNVSSAQQSIAGLWLNDSVLEVQTSDNTLYLSAQTGAVLETSHSPLFLTGSDSHYYAVLPMGSLHSYIFGSPDEAPRSLLPKNSDDVCCFLPNGHSAVTLTQTADSGALLEYYDLSSGQCTSSLPLQAAGTPENIASGQNGIVFFWCYDAQKGHYILYRWDTAMLPSHDQTDYTANYFSEAEPDYNGLARCKTYAREIGEKYGIEVLVYDDVLSLSPTDFVLEAEYLVPVIQQELKNLDSYLGNYPADFLQKLGSSFEGLTISLVRQIHGSIESGNLDSSPGISYWDGYHAYITLAAGSEAEKTLYHELCHLIDTVVLTESIAYDQWERLNPLNFSYTYDYTAEKNMEYDKYLQDGSRAFIDTYSMHFPKEDRARIMEYAMTPGNENYFRSVTMQNKLLKLCEGIRAAFGLKKSPENFLWEQYLNVPLAYTQQKDPTS